MKSGAPQACFAGLVKTCCVYDVLCWPSVMASPVVMWPAAQHTLILSLTFVLFLSVPVQVGDAALVAAAIA